ncbi:MAG TPA: ABC transporter substrate-binding protein [Xanthobacteraceae bacterium]|nr:ABC transporter substrate-binding protein [Xanthobacteraceae bacterium]
MQFDRLRRREFITLLGGAAAWPLAARAQQPAIPVIGFLDARLPDAMADRLRGFCQGLGEAGYVEGDNVTILYRWGENKVDRLPELAAELVRRRMTVIIGSGAATATIPVLFIVSEDPVRLGLVKSLARPEGNLTGINFFNSELVAKQLELLRELVPQAAAVAVLVNPASPNTFETTLRDIEPAARAMGVQIKIMRASTGREIDAAFATLAQERSDALFVGNDAFFNCRRVQLVQLAAHHRLPAIYSGREYSEIGGLISYGTNVGEAYRQLGLYAGRILKGAKPSDLPAVQSSKFELIINHQTARTLGLTVSDKLLVAADEVIE